MTNVAHQVRIHSLVLLCAFLLGGALTLPFLPSTWSGVSDGKSERAILIRPQGDEIVFVYIGSSTCGPSNLPEMFTDVRSVRSTVMTWTNGHGYGFTTIGIARDRNIDAGVRHLKKVGGFDEIVSGRSWYNLGGLRYIWDTVPGIAATPQIVVLLRQYSRPGEEDAFVSETLLARKVGIDEIARWRGQETPLPVMAVSPPFAAEASGH